MWGKRFSGISASHIAVLTFSEYVQFTHTKNHNAKDHQSSIVTEKFGLNGAVVEIWKANGCIQWRWEPT